MSASAPALAPPCTGSARPASTPMVLGGNGVFGEITAGYDYMVSERFLIGGFMTPTLAISALAQPSRL